MSRIPATTQRIDSVREFNRFYTRRIGALGNHHLDSELSLTEARVLYELAQRENALSIDLVTGLGLDAGYLSRILARFQKLGWLKRERSPDDARKSFLKLTAKGRKKFASLEARTRDHVGQLLASLPADQQLKLEGHLQHAQALIERARAETVGDLLLREHRPGDIGWIIHKHGLLYTEEYGWNVQFEALVAEICAQFVQKFDPSGERCWIAERDGVPVGCIMLVRQSRTVAKLRLLLVESSQRGLGVGGKLVDTCLRFARQAGYRTVTLWTQSILVSARRIYEAHGFKLVKSEPHESFGAQLIGETWELALL